MVTLKEAWNSYILLLQSLKKSAATMKQYNMDGQHFLSFAHEKNYLYVDHHFQELLQIYGHYLKETYHNINTFNHKIATMRGFVDFIFLREWIEPFDYQHILQPRKRQKEALQVLTNKQIGQMANVWPFYFQYACTNEVVAFPKGKINSLYCESKWTPRGKVFAHTYGHASALSGRNRNHA